MKWASLGLLLLLASLSVLGAIPAANAQPKPDPSADRGPAPAASASPAGQDAAPDSPRAAMRQFVELCREGELQEAARFLDVPPKADGPGLARRLKAVLDRHLWDEIERTSPFSSGNVGDKLAPGIDAVGQVPGPRGPEPVLIVRRVAPQGGTWVFTRATVERIPVWYGRLDDRWLFDALPDALLRPGPFELLYWQIFALPFLVLAAYAIGRVFSFLTRKLLGRVVARTSSHWDDTLLRKLGGPLTLAWALGSFAIATPWLGLYEPARDLAQKVVRAGFLAALFWSALRGVDVAKGHWLEGPLPAGADRRSAPDRKEEPARRSAPPEGDRKTPPDRKEEALRRSAPPAPNPARSLVPLGAQLTKLVILALAAATVLSELGYSAASLVAGLGIGGVALALAAQKTVENLFGSLSIGVDQPFRVGDFIKVEDVQGTVEIVGLRSTRIRTLDRTLVTIPNGKLADMRIESYAPRDRYRVHCLVGLVYGTTAEQIREVLTGIESVLRTEPSFYSEDWLVALKSLGASSLDIEVMAWFDVPAFGDFVRVRERVLLGILEVVERAGTSLAFPTQTLHVVPPNSDVTTKR